VGIIKSLFILAAGVVLATFVWSNYDQPVVIYFTKYARTVPLPLAAALVLSLVAGLLLAVMLSLPNQFRLRGRIRELGRKIDRLENENAELRKLPLDDSLPGGAAKGKEPTRIAKVATPTPPERRDAGGPGGKTPGA
jgi:uncharacterized integral membrane protein